ncbi:phosphoenolpyruvate hydrolase family protein [Luethyella okanaganae]|uniref:Phosphoenolpyruvate hydrolase family protein n=1 Tax=Luethyella okanaganae TaxID=69372 RepID=A0ABW1VK00_9MICO
MIAERDFTQQSIIDRLAATRAAGAPIVSVTAGVGIIAKCAEVAGVDLIFVTASGRSRHLGVPTTVNIGNATQMTLDMLPEIDNVVERTPLIAGIEATDGSRRRLSRVIDQFIEVGFDGVTNFPTVGTFPGWGEARKDVGEGTDREFELITAARDRGLYTVGQAYTVELAKGTADAGAHLVIARCGLTFGGRRGPEDSQTIEQAAEHVQAIVDAAKGANPEVLVLAHGGPFGTPESTDFLYAHTGVDGIHAESGVERIPVEDYVEAEIAAFKNQSLRESARAV